MAEVDEEDRGSSPIRDHHDVTDNSSSSIVWTPVPVNSHLYHSAMCTTTTGLHFPEDEIKSRRRVALIMSEMVQTERDYVRALQLVIVHYMPELESGDLPQTLHGRKAVIFGNIEKIYHFHSQHFLKLLEKCHNQPFLVGQFFLQHENMFQLYPLYNKNKPRSDCLMMECGKKFFRQKQIELGDKMDLSSYLLKPVQRLGKYALLLKQLLKECAETELEYPDLKAAETMVKFQLRHGNDLLAMDSLRGCDNVSFQVRGRLLRQDEFIVHHGLKKSMKRIFLFENQILFSKTKRARQGMHDTYKYKTSFKTADIGLTENYGDCGCQFEIWFNRRSIRNNYVLQASNSEIKKAWVEDISLILWRQAIYNKESQINNLATMGIGRKPRLDIQPSEHNIQDRTINLLFNSKKGRTRNSVVVSPYGNLRNGQKRPHSIISVSSTSSGSSQSSFGLPGSLNIAFGLLNSPILNRRSILLNDSANITNDDASAGSLSSESRTSYHHASAATFSSVRTYFDVLKSRVLKHKRSNPGYTDV